MKPSALGCECKLPFGCEWDAKLGRPVVDLSKLSRIWQINNINWSAYCDEEDKTWVRYIKYPVSQRDLDLMCTLSKLPEIKYQFNWSAGELFYKEKK